MTDTLLYPRLPPALALQLFNEARMLTPAELRERSRTTHPDAVFAALGGVEATEAHLRTLADEVRGAADASGFPESKFSSEARDAFDLACAGVLHEQMGIVAGEASSVDVWAFLGVVVLPDVCFWRFPDPPADRVIGPDLTRHTLSRLWWRAYQLENLVPNGGLSALIAIPENEMNQLFERRTIGGNRSLVRTIADVLISPAPTWKSVERRRLVRDSISRIRRLIAFSKFDALDQEALEPMIRSIFDEAASALSGSAVGATEREADPQETHIREQPAHDERDASLLTSTDPAPAAPSLEFDHAVLAGIPAQIATLVNELGGVADEDLVLKYEERFQVHVPSGEQDLLHRFAWSAKGRRFIELDEENDLWLPGKEPPTSVEQLGDWTIARIYERAAALLRSQPNEDPFEQLISEVDDTDGGRVPRLVMRLVGKIVNRAKRDVNGRTPRRRRTGA